MRPTIVIVDDHESFRRFAQRLLDAEGFNVVGEARDGAEAVEKVRALRPELVLLDIRLPDVDGFGVAEQLALEDDRPLVVLTSSRDVLDLEDRLRRTQAHGFLPKSELSGGALAALIATG